MNNSKRFKTVLLLIVSIFIISCLSEPTPPETVGIISGTIYNSETMEVIQGVTIITEPAVSSIITGADGKFEIIDVPEDIYELSASHPIYETKSTTVQVLAGRSVFVDLQLNPLSTEMSISEEALNFGTSTDNLTFYIQNIGIGTMNWSLSKNQSWLTVSPTSGTTITETDIVNVSVNRSDYSPGNYTDVISLTSNSNAMSVSVIMTVADTTGPQLSVSPSSFDFGTEITQKSFEISNTGVGSLTWNASTSENWIDIETNSGTILSGNSNINISIIRTNLAVGTYSGNILFTSNGGNQTVNVNVTIPNEPIISVSSSNLDFGSTTNTMTFDVSNSGVNDLNWTISDNQDWITTTPNSGTNLGTVNVTISRDGFSPGDYSGTVTVSSNNGSQSVSINMNVPAEQPPTAVVLTDPSNITTNSMTLAWSRNYDSDFAAYRLYYSTSPAVTENSSLATTITDNNTNSYTVTGLSNSTTYYFKVYVMDTAQMTTGSNVVSASTSAILGNWVLTENIPNVTFSAVWFNSENDGYAVGESSVIYDAKIYHWGGSNWVEEVVHDDALDLYDVRFIDANNGYAVGNSGTFLYYNGVSWSEFNSPTYSSIEAVFPLSNDNIWTYASDDIYHWDGSEWTSTHLDISYIRDIYFINENDGWVVDQYGKMFHYNGIGWAFHSNVENYYVSNGELYFLNSSEGWYINNYNNTGNAYNFVYHYDGSSWTRYEDNDYPIYRVTRIQEISASNIWAVGYGGLIFNFDGERWNSVTSPTSNDLIGIFMLNASDGWAVGENGVILRYH
ncbi:MAG: carboxypeptidase-like regulatory domain-containing protein [Candidatus Marinimicrobia bacterium]|nr:carboxypeptidase-like regulatory domain-containing protein [Candidatus Neomarinimicrobiota bacterium]